MEKLERHGIKMKAMESHEKVKCFHKNKDEKKISQQQPGTVMESYAILEGVVADMC